MFKKIDNKGFTLVEIMIVVGIIALLASFAIPNFLRMRVTSNESTALATLRTINSACESFRSAQNPPGYPASLAALGNANPPYIDSNLAAGSKQGYTFTYSFVNANQFTCTATPLLPNVTGTQTFFVDESGVIRLNNAGGIPVE